MGLFLFLLICVFLYYIYTAYEEKGGGLAGCIGGFLVIGFILLVFVVSLIGHI